MSKSRGFTLIELLVVIFIIATLASLVIINVSNARKSSRDAKRIADLKTIQGALEMYFEKNTGYPKTGDFASAVPNTVTNMRVGCNTGWCGMCSTYNTATQFTINNPTTGWIPSLVPDYLNVLPVDPKPTGATTSLPYGETGCYIYKSNGTDYKVVAKDTMETCGDGTSQATGCTATTNPISFQEMADPNQVSGRYLSIAVYTSGARSW